MKITLPSGKSGEIQLLRIRNPWGNEAEWKGAWGDRFVASRTLLYFRKERPFYWLGWVYIEKSKEVPACAYTEVEVVF